MRCCRGLIDGKFGSEIAFFFQWRIGPIWFLFGVPGSGTYGRLTVTPPTYLRAHKRKYEITSWWNDYIVGRMIIKNKQVFKRFKIIKNCITGVRRGVATGDPRSNYATDFGWQCLITGDVPSVRVPSVLWHCWLGVRKSIRPVKCEWWGIGVVICL